MTHHPLLLWSGGFDSTLLLARGDIKYDLLTITHEQVPGRRRAKVAKDKILTWLAEARKPIGTITNVSVSSNLQGVSGEFAQATLWATFGALYALDGQDVHVGWIRRDDVWHNIDRVRDVFYATMKSLHKTGHLVMPSEWLTKEDVLNEVLSHPGLFNLCTSCESLDEESDDCGHCVPCTNRIVAMRNIALSSHKVAPPGDHPRDADWRAFLSVPPEPRKCEEVVAVCSEDKPVDPTLVDFAKTVCVPHE